MPQTDVNLRNPVVHVVSRLGRISAVKFLAVLVLWIMTAPFVERFDHTMRVESVLLSIVLLSAVFAVGGRRRMLAIAVAFLVPAIGGKWANHIWPHLVPSEIFLASGILFCGFIVSQLLRFVIVATKVDVQVLAAGVAGYLMVGILWGLAYILAGNMEPNSFAFSGEPPPDHRLAGFAALYFSFVTLSTAGYGDIVPTTSTTRMLAILEQTVGVFYVAVLIARLVSAYADPNSARVGTEENR